MSGEYPSQKWKVDTNTADEIKRYLIQQGGLEDKDIKSENEVWRVKFSDATLTYYKSGTLFCTASRDTSIKKVWEFISSRAESRFIPPTKDFLIGLDEVGKGEILGHTILVGAIFPKIIFNELEWRVGVADTKKRRSTAY